MDCFKVVFFIFRFEVHQTVYRETDPEELYTSYSNSVSENKVSL